VVVRRWKVLDQLLVLFGSGRCGDLVSASRNRLLTVGRVTPCAPVRRRVEDCPLYVFRFEKVRDRETRSPARQRRALPQPSATMRFFQIKHRTNGDDLSRINLSMRYVVVALDVIEIDRVGDSWLLI
jgi:hypothetical protein